MVQIHWTFRSPVESDRLRENMEHNHTTGWPGVGQSWPLHDHVAVVGGSHSVADVIDELRAFDGDIWAVNGAANWLSQHGIDAALFSIDPHPVLADVAHGPRRALLATQCDPSVFAALVPEAKVEAFDCGPGAIEHGTTTATAAPSLALVRGVKRMTFYGCAASYAGGSHVYKDIRDGSIEVMAGGRSYLTNPAFLKQSEFLAELIREAPGVFAERSGGLLAALVADPSYDIVAASRSIHEGLTWLSR